MPYSMEETGAAIDELAKTFTEFRAENDAALAEMKAKGATDPVQTEKVDRINTAVSDLDDNVKRLVEANEADKKAIEEAEAKAAALAERIDGMEARMNRTPTTGDAGKDEALAKYAEAFWRDEATARNAKAYGVEAGPEAFDAYVENMKQYLRFGKDDPRINQKELSVGVEADGGYWVTPEMSNTVVRRVFETSPIRSIASVVTISTDALEYPTNTNSAVSGGWVGEKTARPETGTPEIGMGRIPVHEQYAAPEVTQKLLDDASVDVEAWLANMIADILGRTENTAFVSGDGASKPRGFTDYSGAAVTTADASRAWGVLQYSPSGAANGFDTATVDGTSSPADEFVDMVYTLNPVYRSAARWVMNRATAGTIRQFKDADGNYVVDRNASNVSGTPFGFTLLGFPITDAEDMDDVSTNAYPIAFGDFGQGYQIVDRQGIRVLRDPFSNKPFVQFYTTKRVGGDVVNFDAIKLMKIATS